MIVSEPRVILDEYRGVNFWTPHYPLLAANVISKNKRMIVEIWDNAYTLTVL